MANRTFSFMLALMFLISVCLLPASAGDNDGYIYALIYDELDVVERMGAEIVVEYDEMVLVRGFAQLEAFLSKGNVDHHLLTDKTLIHLTTGIIDTSSTVPAVSPELRGGGNLHLVQLIGPVKSEWRDDLAAFGQILDYIPNFTYIMELNPGAQGQLRQLGFVEWIGPYHAAYRIDPAIYDGVDAVQIRFYDQVDVKAVNAAGLEIEAESARSVIARGNLDAIKNVALMDNVAFIEPFIEPELHNHIANPTINSPIVHAQGLTGAGQIGAIIDTGIYWYHEQFEGRIVDFIDVAGDAAAGDGDGHGHGTHVAGSVLGDAPPYDVHNNYDGVAFGANAVAVKIFTNAGGYAGGANYYGFWEAAYLSGARVNNNSWGSASGGAYGASDHDADRLVWDYPNYVTVTSAGNSGSGANTTGSPGNAKNVISVGALERANPENVAWFSSRGPTNDGRINPDVMAPGHPITSAQRGTVGGYTDMSGTSMSGPQVAGAALLVRDYFESGFYPSGYENPGDGFEPSAALVKAVLINGAVEITGAGAYQQAHAFPNNDQGWGRIDLDRSLYFAGDERVVTVWDNPGHLSTGAIWTGTYYLVDGTRDLKFTLTWTDYPAPSGANPTIQNDLDLEVIAPDGTVFRGNNFTSYDPGYSVPGGVFDRHNTVEGVHLIPGLSTAGPLPTGNWTVRVRGHNVPRFTQNFSLVVSSGPYDVEDPPPPPEDAIALMGDYNNDLEIFLVGRGYDVSVYASDAYASVIGNLDNYAVVVLHQVSNTAGFNDLLNAVAAQERGIIFASSYTAGSHGMGVLSSRTGDPGNVGSNWGSGQVQIEVVANHPVLDGYGVGSIVTIISGGDNDYQTYSGYTGLTIGRSAMPSGYTGMIGVEDRADTGGARHVVMGSFGSCNFTRQYHWTAHGEQIFINAINWAGDL